MKTPKEEFFHFPDLEICRFVEMAQKFPAHFHDHYTIGFLLSGCRAAFCGHLRIQLLPRELFLVNPGQPHGCEADARELSEWLCIHIPVKTMEEIWTKIFGIRSLPQVKINVVRDGKLCQSLLHILEYARSADVEKIGQKLTGLIADLKFRDLLSGVKASSLPAPDILPASLLTNPQDVMSLGEMAAQANMDKFQLVRQFRRSLGITPWAYLENLRVNRAMSMLRAGASPGMAALDSGFWDQSHFSRRFKAYTGFTPGCYRRACQ